MLLLDLEKDLQFDDARSEYRQIVAWWCNKPTRNKDVQCLAEIMRDASPEKREKIRKRARKEPPANTKTRMIEAWCSLDNRKDGPFCTDWKEEQYNATVAVETDTFNATAYTLTLEEEYFKKHAHRERLKNEEQLMKQAYCTEGRMHEFPCLEMHIDHLLRTPHVTAETYKEIDVHRKQIRESTQAFKKAGYDAITEFWCNDPTQSRDDHGICLAWKMKRDYRLAHEAQVQARAGNLPDPTGGAGRDGSRQVDGALFQKEIQAMHEWFCTKTTPENEDRPLCMDWRLQLKKASTELRAKYEAVLVAMREKRKGFEAKRMAAIATNSRKEFTKAEADLREFQEHGRRNYNEMRKAWCEQGDANMYATGPQMTEPSEVCFRWRRDTAKEDL